MSEPQPHEQPHALTEQAGPPAEPPVKMDRPVEARVFNVVEMTGRAYCNDEDSLARCIDLDKALQQAEKAVNDEHKAMTEGITASKRYIDEKRRRLIDALTAARKYVQGELIAPYRDQKRREAEEEAARARQEAEQEALSTAEQLEAEGKAEEAARALEEGAELASGIGTVQQTGPARGHTAGTASFTEVWDFEIEDEWEVPRAFCRPDPALIREAIRRKDPPPLREIPGVKIFKREKMVNR